MDSGIGQFIPLILIFVIFYFFLIRPQQKKVKEHKAMVENLSRGDKVVTSAGIIGQLKELLIMIKLKCKLLTTLKLKLSNLQASKDYLTLLK